MRKGKEECLGRVEVCKNFLVESCEVYHTLREQVAMENPQCGVDEVSPAELVMEV